MFQIYGNFDSAQQAESQTDFQYANDLVSSDTSLYNNNINLLMSYFIYNNFNNSKTEKNQDRTVSVFDKHMTCYRFYLKLEWVIPDSFLKLIF